MTWLDRLIGREDLKPLRHLADEMGFTREALRMAARQGRLTAQKRGHFWFSSMEAIEQAVAEGKIRR